MKNLKTTSNSFFNGPYLIYFLLSFYALEILNELYFRYKIHYAICAVLLMARDFITTLCEWMYIYRMVYLRRPKLRNKMDCSELLTCDTLNGK